MNKQNKTTLQLTIDELTEKLVEYNSQKESLENKISFLDSKEVSSTKKLYKSYKANNVDITYNDTKALIKEHKFLFQVSINELIKKINVCSKELNENKSHLVFLEFLDEECAKDVEQKKKAAVKKAAKKANKENTLESMYEPISTGISVEIREQDQILEENRKQIMEQQNMWYDKTFLSKHIDEIPNVVTSSTLQQNKERWVRGNNDTWIKKEDLLIGSIIVRKGTNIEDIMEEIVDAGKVWADVNPIVSLGLSDSSLNLLNSSLGPKDPTVNSSLEVEPYAYNSDENVGCLEDMYEPIINKNPDIRNKASISLQDSIFIEEQKKGRKLYDIEMIEKIKKRCGSIISLWGKDEQDNYIKEIMKGQREISGNIVF